MQTFEDVIKMSLKCYSFTQDDMGRFTVAHDSTPGIIDANLSKPKVSWLRPLFLGPRNIDLIVIFSKIWLSDPNCYEEIEGTTCGMEEFVAGWMT